MVETESCLRLEYYVEANWPSFLKKFECLFKLEMKWPLFLCHILHLDSIRPVSTFNYDYDYYFLHSDRISNQENSDMHNIPQRFRCNLHVYFIPNGDYFMQHCQHCYTVSTYTCLQHIFFWLLNQIISHAFKQTLQKLFEMMRH